VTLKGSLAKHYSPQDAEYAEKDFFTFLLRGQKREITDATRENSHMANLLPKGMIFFFAGVFRITESSISSKEKLKSSLRTLRL
jgi:hypothetical protein